MDPFLSTVCSFNKTMHAKLNHPQILLLARCSDLGPLGVLKRGIYTSSESAGASPAGSQPGSLSMKASHTEADGRVEAPRAAVALRCVFTRQCTADRDCRGACRTATREVIVILLQRSPLWAVSKDWKTTVTLKKDEKDPRLSNMRFHVVTIAGELYYSNISLDEKTTTCNRDWQKKIHSVC